MNSPLKEVFKIKFYFNFKEMSEWEIEQVFKVADFNRNG